jgi:hypothetical protein
LSVTSTLGTRRCFFISLARNRFAAFASRFDCTRMSRTLPSWSTARRLARDYELLRARSNSYYADPDVMPTAEAECLGGTSAGSGTIGVTGRFSTERFAERKREPRPL